MDNVFKQKAETTAAKAVYNIFTKNCKQTDTFYLQYSKYESYHKAYHKQKATF